MKSIKAPDKRVPGSIQAGAIGALRALFRFWPGEPFLCCDEQREIAQLLYRAGYTKRVMADSNLSRKLRNPRPTIRWQLQVCKVLRLETIGLDVKVLMDDEETAFRKVELLLSEWPSVFESNCNTANLIILTHVPSVVRAKHGVHPSG